jgi:hypothetical protein
LLLLPLVYDELRRLAAQKVAQEKPGQTLQATALVHEAYLRLVGGEADVRWNSRGHFIAAAAEAMRRILVMWQCRSESSPRRSQLEPGFIERGTFCVKRLRRAAVIEIIPWNGSSGTDPKFSSPRTNLAIRSSLPATTSHSSTPANSRTVPHSPATSASAGRG